MNKLDINIVSTGDIVTHPSEVFIARHLINGQWLDSQNGEIFERKSPSHGHVVSQCANGGIDDVNAAIDAARSAFDTGIWADLSGKDRAGYLNKVADLIGENIDRIALYETMESGKPITQAKDEIAGSVDLWRYAAILARTIHGDTHNNLGNYMLGLVIKEPIGVVSLITPWNFPFLIISQKLPYALAAGCTAVVKPSEMTSATTVILGELIQQAGIPAGVVNIVLGYGQNVGSPMTTHKSVDMVSFTGSTMVGKHIAAATSDTLKKVALELGGKNPQVVFPDANIENAIDAITFGIYFNAGECCNSGSRIIVHEDVAKQVIDGVVKLSQKVPFGNPLNVNTKVGAIISDDHNRKIDDYVESAKKDGAKIEIGGNKLTIDGLSGQFYSPTIISNVTPDMAIATDEVFGPVLSVLTFKTFDEAMALVNNVDYGLSAGVWSDDVHTCLKFARKAQVGTVWTNTWMDGFSELPFGGVKQSGMGRELGKYGIEEYLEIKTVQMRIGHDRNMWV